MVLDLLQDVTDRGLFAEGRLEEGDELLALMDTQAVAPVMEVRPSDLVRVDNHLSLLVGPITPVLLWNDLVELLSVSWRCL